MYAFDSNVNLLIQGLIVIVIIGVFYNLLISTRIYGGIIGKSIRLLGFGILFLSIAVIERLLLNFSIIQPDTNLSLLQDALSMVGLVFLGLGFSKLSSAGKN